MLPIGPTAKEGSGPRRLMESRPQTAANQASQLHQTRSLGTAHSLTVAARISTIPRRFLELPQNREPRPLDPHLGRRSRTLSPMRPVLRAAADQLIMDVAIVDYAGASVAARCDAQDAPTWPAFAALVAHLGRFLEAFAGYPGQGLGIAGAPAACEWPVPGRPPVPPPLAESLAALHGARDRLAAAISAVAAGPPRIHGDGHAAAAAIARACSHISHHALDFIDTLPHLRDDAFFLNWALWPGIDEPPALGARRQSFLIDFRIQSDAHQEDSRP